METTAGIDQKPPQDDGGVQGPPTLAESVADAKVRPTGQAASGPAEATRPGRRWRGWARTLGRWLLGLVMMMLAALAYLLWGYNPAEKLPAGFAAANGRVEATQVDVATKAQNRIAEILADEGDFVSAGQVVARMDTSVLDAQLREAQAQFRLAKSNVDGARAVVAQRDRQKAAGDSIVAQHEAQASMRSRHFDRVNNLASKGSATADELDSARAAFFAEKAAVDEAKAQVTAAEAAIAAARSQVIEAAAAVEASMARIERIRAELEDCVLKAPRDGRVQYRIAQPGEVLGAGGNVLNLVDLTDVYMTFFLPEASAGRVRMGTEVHIVLDAYPQYVVPAGVSFVADVAQFTPKTVETAEERQKLTFRVKAKIDKELLKQYIRDVKTGLPGIAYVRLDANAEWPERLRVRLPR
ncbi:HlyD family secretion protein [Singulisphaera sp. PoT]|uniref:HlyD family secretion protein n=1 Tax=Singulisphaera sp. PoT TaxID=3411797 RepID=UPI003BF4901B